MPVADLPTEALALAWAAQLRAATWEEVVAWADGWILRLDSPPAEVLDLSLSGGRPDEAFTWLRRLAQSGDPEAALSILAGRLLQALNVGAVGSDFLAVHLRRLDFLSVPEVPDDVRLPEPPEEFLAAVRELPYLLESWSPQFTGDVTAEVTEALQRFR